MIAWLLACGGQPVEPAVPEPQLVDVVVAARDLPPGHPIRANDLEVTKVPTELFPPSAKHTADEVVGRVVEAGIWARQPFIEARLDPRQAFTLKPGMAEKRLSLPALAPLLQHGDVLDIVRGGPDPCLVMADLYVVGTSGDATVRVAGPSDALGRIDRVANDARVVLLRGFDSPVPALPACAEAR